MFDVEYGEYLTGRSVAPKTEVELSREQVTQLAEVAINGAEKDEQAWRMREETMVANKALALGKTWFSRFLANFSGAPYASTPDEASKLAKATIDVYPNFMTNWQAAEAKTLGRKWKAVASNLPLIEPIRMPVSEFNELRNWAARA